MQKMTIQKVMDLEKSLNCLSNENLLTDLEIIASEKNIPVEELLFRIVVSFVEKQRKMKPPSTQFNQCSEISFEGASAWSQTSLELNGVWADFPTIE